MRALTWVEAGRRLRSLSAALVLSTSLTVPALAVDATFSGTLTGPIDLGDIDIFFSSASLTSLSGDGFSLNSVTTKFENVGTINARDVAVGVEGSTGTFINGGTIASSGSASFGSIAVRLENTLSTNSFLNKLGASIAGDDGGVSIESSFGSFTNAGSITGSNASGVRVFGAIDSFTNESTGVIDGVTAGVGFGNTIRDFTNAGEITSAGLTVDVGGDVTGSFVNSGSVISTGSTALYFEGSVAKLRNDGTVRGAWGLYSLGHVGSFINGEKGIISGSAAAYFGLGVDTFVNEGNIDTTAQGIQIDGPVGLIRNAGTISNGDDFAFYIYGSVDSFDNSGTISGHDVAVRVYGPVEDFFNSGTIEADNGKAVAFTSNLDDVGSFENRGTIKATDIAVQAQGDVESFVNATGASITTTGSYGLSMGDVTGFSNAGRIEALDTAAILSNVGTFSNSGTMTSYDSDALVLANVSTFINTATGVIGTEMGRGVRITGDVGSFANSGTIRGGADRGVEIAGDVGSFVNSGTISGSDGAVSFGGASGTTFVNSGTIEAASGAAIGFSTNGADDTLVLLTGSRIFGHVDFSDANDTLNVSGFRGNALLNVVGLDTVVAGSTLVASSLDGNGEGTVSIIDATGITSSGSASLGEVAGAIGGEIAGALGGITGGAGPTEPMGYAPSRPVGAAEAAADELIATADPTGPEVWGKVFGGIANKTNDYNAVLGGIIAGSHVAVDASTRLGGVVSVSGSRFVTAGGGQTVTGAIGAAGLYGSTDLGGVVVSYSVLGGVAANHSDRIVTAMVTETARADFGSWFWSPELGLSMPVPLFEGVETDAGFKLRYVGGGVGSYTETGSSQNLSVGTAAVNLLDARVELTSKTQVASNDFGDVMLYGTAGLLAQQNFGGSVAIAGFPIAQTPASFAYGAYADVTLEGPIGPTAKASASTGLELRSDGLSSASANLGLSAEF